MYLALGKTCAICGFDFAKGYDGIGDGFIHVHHITPISEIGKGYMVDPINDLIPVCPNCHAVLHKYKRPYGIEEARKMVRFTVTYNP